MQKKKKILDEEWMRKTIEEAERAMIAGELPIASILVSDGIEVSRAQTQVGRRGSMVAHGEVCALLAAGGKLFTADHPLILYTNLEPCLMCVGATMQCGIDKIVYGLQCLPDGGVRYVDDIRTGGQEAPEIEGGVLERESLALFHRFVKENPSHFAIDYVLAILDPYKDTF